MNLAFASAAAVLFGGGAFLLLQRDLLRIVAGVALISQAATLTLIGVSRSRGQAPIAPEADLPVSDPLPQALTLTALVIGLATLALLLSMVDRLVVVFDTAYQQPVPDEEEDQQEDQEADQQPDQEADQEADQMADQKAVRTAGEDQHRQRAEEQPP